LSTARSPKGVGDDLHPPPLFAKEPLEQVRRPDHALVSDWETQARAMQASKSSKEHFTRRHARVDGPAWAVVKRQPKED
jgi:hypothetical protein